jgi:hypothetical protein
MRFRSPFSFALFVAVIFMLSSHARMSAQESAVSGSPASIEMPEAPLPQVAHLHLAAPDLAAVPQNPPAPAQSGIQSGSDTPPGQSSPAQSSPAQSSPAQSTPAQSNPAPGSTPAQQTQTNPPQGSSSSQADAKQTPQTQDQRDTAQKQIKEQETQRVLGIVPSFNVNYRSDAVSMTAGQKISLAFHSSIDPVTFGVAGVVAGLHEALDDDTGFRWGPEGYFRRAGAAYLDAFNGTMIGNGFLPALLHQDPRYFRLGHGSATHRLLYAMSTSFICHHDHTGKWEPNYSNVAGNIISGAISNLYYPDSNSGIGLTISNGFIVTAEGMAGGVFAEFWPDISRKFLHKDPTNGRDAQARALDAQEKQTRKEAKEKQQRQQPPQSNPQ